MPLLQVSKSSEHQDEIFGLTNSAGYPIATAPIGQLRYNGRPFGLCVLARANEEELLLRFMAAYEAVAKPRPVPDL
jgi:amidase